MIPLGGLIWNSGSGNGRKRSTGLTAELLWFQTANRCVEHVMEPQPRPACRPRTTGLMSTGKIFYLWLLRWKSTIFITGLDERINSVVGWISVQLKPVSQSPQAEARAPHGARCSSGTWLCLPVDPQTTKHKSDDEKVHSWSWPRFQLCRVAKKCRRHISTRVFPPDLCSWQYFHYNKTVKVVPAFPFYCLKLHIPCDCDYFTEVWALE